LQSEDADASAELLNSPTDNTATSDAIGNANSVDGAEVTVNADAAADADAAVGTDASFDTDTDIEVDTSVVSQRNEIATGVNKASSKESEVVSMKESADLKEQPESENFRARVARTTTISTEESLVPEVEDTVDITIRKKAVRSNEENAPATVDVPVSSFTSRNIASQLVPQSSPRPGYRKTPNRWKAEILKMMALDQLTQAEEEHRLFKLEFPSNAFSEIDLADIE